MERIKQYLIRFWSWSKTSWEAGGIARWKAIGIWCLIVLFLVPIYARTPPEKQSERERNDIVLSNQTVESDYETNSYNEITERAFNKYNHILTNDVPILRKNLGGAYTTYAHIVSNEKNLPVRMLFLEILQKYDSNIDLGSEYAGRFLESCLSHPWNSSNLH